MVRTFAVPQFFRQMPNALLKRFFAECEPINKIDFEKMPESKPDVLLKAWEALPAVARQKLEPKLREIFDLASSKGVIAITDESKFKIPEPEEQAAFVEALAKMKNHHERAMTVFLDFPEIWSIARHFWRADSLRYWRVRRGFPRKAASQNHADRRAFEADIGQWFRKNQACGRLCTVEVYRRDDRDYFFAYPEDFADETTEYVDDKLDRRAHNPAFEVLFVWREKEGALDINCRGDKKVLEAMQEIFAKRILKLSALPRNPAKSAFELDGLKDRNFQFVYDAGQGIEAVWVRRLRFSSLSRYSDRITFEADTASNRFAVYDLIKQANLAIPMNRLQIAQAFLSARFAATADKPAWTTSFTVTAPNSTNLKHDPDGLKLRAMLSASGIEVK